MYVRIVSLVLCFGLMVCVGIVWKDLEQVNECGEYDGLACILEMFIFQRRRKDLANEVF